MSWFGFPEFTGIVNIEVHLRDFNHSGSVGIIFTETDGNVRSWT